MSPALNNKSAKSRSHCFKNNHHLSFNNIFSGVFQLQQTLHVNKMVSIGSNAVYHQMNKQVNKNSN